MSSSPAERVARGAQWLDVTAPGWERRIDLNTLALKSGCYCVLGQVEPYGAGHRNGFDETAACHAWPWVIAHGFDANPVPLEGIAADYAALQAEWERTIKARFGSGALSDGGAQ